MNIYLFDEAVLHKLKGQGDRDVINAIKDDLEDKILEGKSVRFYSEGENGFKMDKGTYDTLQGLTNHFFKFDE